MNRFIVLVHWRHVLGVQVVAAKAASPVGTALSAAGTGGFTAQLGGPGGGIDPYQQAMQQYTCMYFCIYIRNKNFWFSSEPGFF